MNWKALKDRYYYDPDFTCQGTRHRNIKYISWEYTVAELGFKNQEFQFKRFILAINLIASNVSNNSKNLGKCYLSNFTINPHGLLG